MQTDFKFCTKELGFQHAQLQCRDAVSPDKVQHMLGMLSQLQQSLGISTAAADHPLCEYTSTASLCLVMHAAGW